MVKMENRNACDWDAGDRLPFASPGLSREAVGATKKNHNAIPGFVNDYLTRLFDRLDTWVNQICEVEKEVRITPNPQEES